MVVIHQLIVIPYTLFSYIIKIIIVRTSVHHVHIHQVEEIASRTCCKFCLFNLFNVCSMTTYDMEC